MSSAITEAKNAISLNATHRCDRCSARAAVMIIGRVGDLMFCGHHYNSIMDNAVGYDKMMKFAVEIVDERYKAESKEELEEAFKR